MTNSDSPVAPGLCISGFVTYLPTDECEKEDRLVVTVDENTVEVPLLGYICAQIFSPSVSLCMYVC